MRRFPVSLDRRGGLLSYRQPGASHALVVGGSLDAVLGAVAVEALAAGASGETTLEISMDGVRQPKLDRPISRALPWQALAVAEVL